MVFRGVWILASVEGCDMVLSGRCQSGNRLCQGEDRQAPYHYGSSGPFQAGQRDPCCVSPKLANMSLNPLEGEPLVPKANIGRFRVLCQPAKHAKSEIGGDRDLKFIAASRSRYIWGYTSCDGRGVDTKSPGCLGT